MKFRISYLCLPIFIIYYLLGNFSNFVLFFLMLILHDIAHLIACLLFKVQIKGFELLPFGGKIFINDNIQINVFQEIIISIAGPLFNIMFAAILVIFKYWNILYFPYYDQIVFCNIVLGLINLVPILPLDGGRILTSILSSFIGYNKAIFFVINISKIFSVILILLSIYLIYNKVYNFSFAIIGVFLFLNSEKEKEHYFWLKAKKILSNYI